MTTTVRAVLVKVTPNTFRFAEVDAKGNVIEMREAKVGTIYVKKSVFAGAKPLAITVSVAVAE